MREILKTIGVRVQDTVYCQVGDNILDFPMSIGNFFRLETDDPSASDFEVLHILNGLVEDKKRAYEYVAVCSELQQVLARLNKMKKVEINNTDQLIAKKLSLRKSKQRLNEMKTALEEQYLAKSIEEIKKECEFGPAFLEYKDSFYCSSFNEIAAILPQVEAVNTPKLKEMPLFVRGIRDLSQSLKKSSQLGIVGGPCLFGAHEVIVDIHHRDGEVVQFDFSTGREYDEDYMLKDYDIESYLSCKYEDIVGLGLRNVKDGVTYQEYLSMQYLFEFAEVLGGKVVIPIPDMSYMKFFQGIMSPIADRVRELALNAFEKISYDITDMYLRVINDLQLQYPEVECQVLHSRNTDLCHLFYTNREEYIYKLSRMGRVTVYKGRTDAVIDYITMLALPFYVYGTHNVLQIDSVDEADSMRKCMKIHGPDVVFSSILFPEYISQDGVHTVYNAPHQFKEYINAGG